MQLFYLKLQLFGGPKMKVKVALLVAGVALLVAALPLQAHHPFTAQYDPDHPVTLTGTVTKVEWSNPHAHIFIDVKDAEGRTTNWEFELGGLKKMRDFGWHRET